MVYVIRTMVTSLGVDIVEVERIERIIRQYGDRFETRILGEHERELLKSRHDRAQFVAGRFAAKEAVIKALGRYLTVRPAYTQIEIVGNGSRGPMVLFDPAVAKTVAHVTVLVSISHEKSYAVGLAVLSEEK